MRHCICRLLVITSSFASLIPTAPVQARCVNTTTDGQATAGVDMPSSGQAVVCDPAAPNPSTTTITSTTGSTGVSIIVLPGAIVSTTPRAIGLNGNASSIVNQGTVNTFGFNASGLATTGTGNVLTSSGSINTTGAGAHGMNAAGSGSVLANSGTIIVSGGGANGIRSTETTSTTSISNSGSITASGGLGTAPAPAILGNGVSLLAGTFQNLAGGTVTSAQAFGVLGGDGDIIVRNFGTIIGGNGSAIQLGNGNDQFIWDGGTISGAVSLGNGNDTATLYTLADAQLAAIASVDGGPGADHLVFDNSNITGFGRFMNWENVELAHNAKLTLDGNGMRLGDAGTGTGTLSIDTTGTLAVADGVDTSIQSFTTGQLVTVRNAGIIDLANGGSSSANTLRISGNYVGMGGKLHLNAALGTDGSPADRLVIAGPGASATGMSRIVVTNAGGPGAITTGNGILVIDTTDGATTAADAFKLGTPVEAGPYEYLLFRSSIDASNPEAWYLRSTLECSNFPYIPACRTGSTIPDYRSEASLYTALPAMVLLYGRNLMGTLHGRLGEERAKSAPGAGADAPLSLGWGRIIALSGTQSGSPYGIFGNGPKYDYDIFAFQSGIDLYRSEHADGGTDTAGLYIAVGQISAGVTHFNRQKAGNNDVTAYTFGGYWTHSSATGWYFDTVAQYTWSDIEANPRDDSGMNTHANGFAASFETGKRFRLGNGFGLEPQGRLTYQTASLADSNDSASAVFFKDVDSLTGQLGIRMTHRWVLDSSETQPRLLTAWVHPSLWHEFQGTPSTEFASATGPIPFRADLESDWIEITTGFDAQISQNSSLYANVSYQADFDSSSHAYGGKLGMRIIW